MADRIGHEVERVGGQQARHDGDALEAGEEQQRPEQIERERRRDERAG
ncbi:MAG: hypothetical protein AB1635_17420 [Acidobacteriota bacterium]